MAATPLGRWLLCMLLAVIGAQLVCSAGDSESRRRLQHYDPGQSFAERFHLNDPFTGRPFSESEYRKLVDRASSHIDGPEFYDKEWARFRRPGYDMLRAGGSLATPADLMRHRQYMDYVTENGKHVPTVFLRLGDLIPTNPMGLFNPDIVVFMHSVQVLRDTDAVYHLEPRFVLRAAEGVPGYQIVWKKRVTFKKSYTWLDELPDVFQWSVLDVIERLGYPPDTVERQLARLPLEADNSLYSPSRTARMGNVLEQSRRYLTQFASARSEDNLIWYSLMLSPVDGDRRLPWFETPVFEHFDLNSGHIELRLYNFEGKRAPVLDRVMYVVSQSRQGRARLTPRAIVRPTALYPVPRFETVYSVPASLQEAASVQLSYIPHLTRPESKGEPHHPLRTMMSRKRPIGHPLDLVHNGALSMDPRSDHEFDDPAMKRPRWQDALTISSPSQRSPIASEDVKDPHGTRTPVAVPLKNVRFAPVESPPTRPTEPSKAPLKMEDPDLLFPPSPRLVPELEMPRYFRRPQAVKLEPQRIHDVPAPSRPPGFEHRSARKLASPQQQAQYFAYRTGQPNPYELPRDNPMDVLTAHLNPHIEDAWHFHRR